MTKSLCPLLILVNNAQLQMFDVANMSFNVVRENKVLAKFSGFTCESILTQIYVFLVFLHFFLILP